MQEMELVETYKQLLSVDNELCGLMNIGFHLMFIKNTTGDFDRKSTKRTLVGSSAEKVNISRMFGKEMNNVEADVMFQLCSFSSMIKNTAVVAVPDRLGIYKVFKDAFKQGLPLNFRDLFIKVIDSWTLGPSSDHDWIFLSGVDAKYVMNKFAKFGDKSQVLPEVSKKHLDMFHITEKQTFRGPSVRLEACVVAPQPLLNVSLDIVGYINLDHWPDEAKEWSNRERFWPSEVILQETMREGCQLVAKPFKMYKGNQFCPEDVDEEEWRMTFSKAENILAKGRSPLQNLVYLVAKCIFYKYLDFDIDDCKFSSYCLKTCMMWMLEETPPEEWIEEKWFMLLSKLYQRLEDCLQTTSLPNFFLPEINILREYPEKMISHAHDIILNINKDLYSFIPAQNEVIKVMGRAKWMMKFIKEVFRLEFKYSAEKSNVGVESSNFIFHLGICDLLKSNAKYQDIELD